jgi:WhiB family redox-sensing transcriptional regulator
VSNEGFSSPEPPFEWVVGALCAATDPDLFFPQKSDSSKTDKAKAVCNACISLDECREYALSMDKNPKGVWAAMTTEERRVERKKR